MNLNTTEAPVLAAAKNLMSLRGFYPIRVNAGAVRLASGGYMHLAPKGTSDLIGIVPRTGRLLAVECKRPGGGRAVPGASRVPPDGQPHGGRRPRRRRPTRPRRRHRRAGPGVLGQVQRGRRAHPMSAKRKCRWPGCEKQVPASLWGCTTHWYMLPKAIRDRIWAAYRSGQEEDLKRVSREWIAADTEARMWADENFPAEPKLF